VAPLVVQISFRDFVVWHFAFSSCAVWFEDGACAVRPLLSDHGSGSVRASLSSGMSSITEVGEHLELMVSKRRLRTYLGMVLRRHSLRSLFSGPAHRGLHIMAGRQ
jgi:hypothetical protein